MVDSAKFWISYHRLAFHSIFSPWQPIQNSAPSTIVWHQCDIRIEIPVKIWMLHQSQFYSIMAGKEKHDFIWDASSLDVSNMSSSTLMIATFDVMVVGYMASGTGRAGGEGFCPRTKFWQISKVTLLQPAGQIIPTTLLFAPPPSGFSDLPSALRYGNRSSKVVHSTLECWRL